MKKKIYSSPDIEIIKLDNEISLALESLVPPPIGPDEVNNINQNQSNNNPFNDGFA